MAKHRAFHTHTRNIYMTNNEFCVVFHYTLKRLSVLFAGAAKILHTAVAAAEKMLTSEAMGFALCHFVIWRVRTLKAYVLHKAARSKN